MWYDLSMEKVYLDEAQKVWVIEDFLTKEELDWFKSQTDDLNGWYPTMRSPYKNILNKFLNTVPQYDENGNIEFPNENSKIIDLPIFSKTGGVWDRLDSVLPPTYKRHATLQTFKYMTDKEIQENLDENFLLEYKIEKNNIDFAMYWHRDPGVESNIVASFSLYLNDDFEGGEIVYINKKVRHKPIANSMVVHLATPEYEHGVGLVNEGTRYFMTNFYKK